MKEHPCSFLFVCLFVCFLFCLFVFLFVCFVFVFVFVLFVCFVFLVCVCVIYPPIWAAHPILHM